LAWVATPTGNMGSAVRRCSTFVRIKRGFGYTQEVPRIPLIIQEGRLYAVPLVPREKQFAG
jgi:hypothetical protein